MENLENKNVNVENQEEKNGNGHEDRARSLPARLCIYIQTFLQIHLPARSVLFPVPESELRSDAGRFGQMHRMRQMQQHLCHEHRSAQNAEQRRVHSLRRMPERMPCARYFIFQNRKTGRKTACYEERKQQQMKRTIVSLLMIAAMSISLLSCGSAAAESASSEAASQAEAASSEESISMVETPSAKSVTI